MRSIVCRILTREPHQYSIGSHWLFHNWRDFLASHPLFRLREEFHGCRIGGLHPSRKLRIVKKGAIELLKNFQLILLSPIGSFAASWNAAVDLRKGQSRSCAADL